MIGTERAGDNVIFHVGSKLFVLRILWDTEDSMGRIPWAKQNIKKPVESSFPNETNIANCHGRITTTWIWLPKCVSVGRILCCQVLTKNIVVGHCSGAEIKGSQKT